MQDYMASLKNNPDKSRLVLAYTKKDVADLNKLIKQEMVKSGKVSNQETKISISHTENGEEIKKKQGFAVGDRILFRENNKDLGVMNGTFGTLKNIEEQKLEVLLDNEKEIKFSADEYNKFQLGYAATVHKSQGMTLDETYVLASKNFDKHTSYVAMTRHKETTKLYASQDDFKNKERLFNQLSKDGEKISTLEFVKERAKTLLRNKIKIKNTEKKKSATNSISKIFNKIKNYLKKEPVINPAKTEKTKTQQKSIIQNLDNETNEKLNAKFQNANKNKIENTQNHNTQKPKILTNKELSELRHKFMHQARKLDESRKNTEIKRDKYQQPER